MRWALVSPNSVIDTTLARGWTCQINPDGLPEWTPPRTIDRHQRPMINSRIAGGAARRYRSRT